MDHSVELGTKYEHGETYAVLECSCGWEELARLGPLSEVLSQRGEHLRSVGAEVSRYVRANLTGNTVQDLAEYATAAGIGLASLSACADALATLNAPPS